MKRCQECGYDYDELARDALSSALRAFIPPYRRVLEHTDPSRLRVKPSSDVWSPLEYACHVRDVFRIQRERIALAMAEDNPVFASMRRLERSDEENYNGQEPDEVAAQLSASGLGLVAALDGLTDAQWQRTGVYSYPTEQVRTMEWIARHTIHEARHHLQDIEEQLR